jgi:hypothetical protein
LLNCFTHAIYGNPTSLHTHVHLHGIAAEIIRTEDRSEMLFDTAVALWCALAVASGCADAAELETVLTALPPRIDDDDIPFAARFLHFALGQWPDAVSPHAARIAAAVAASGGWLTRFIPADALSVVAGIVFTIPEDELWGLVNFNQSHFLQLQKVKSLVTSLPQ